MRIGRVLPAPTAEERAHHRRRMERPLEALATLTELRGTLDRVERRLVAEARHVQSTWEEIGAALGVSRQAAHRRHRDDVHG